MARPARSPRSTLLLWTERGLWIASALILLWVTVAWADGFIYQLWQGRQLEQALAAGSGEAAPQAPAEELPAELPGDAGIESGGDETAAAAPRLEVGEPTRLEVGEPVGRLLVPRLDLDVVVAHGSDARTLRRAAGHLPGSPLPVAGGNVAVAGHRDRHFRPLKDIEVGDEIEMVTPDGSFRYQVEWMRVLDPDDVWVLHPTTEPALTLVTCYPFYYVGSAPDRFVVRARRVAAEYAPQVAAAQ